MVKYWGDKVAYKRFHAMDQEQKNICGETMSNLHQQHLYQQQQQHVYDPCRLTYASTLAQANHVRTLASDLAITRKLYAQWRQAPTNADKWCPAANMTSGVFAMYNVAMREPRCTVTTSTTSSTTTATASDA